MLSLPRQRVRGQRVMLACALLLLARTQPGFPQAPPADYRDLDHLLTSLPNETAPPLDEARALWLAALPLACLDQTQPRPASRPYFWIASARLVDDHERNRAFWGCTDWSSAVSSTWTLIRLLKSYPTLSLDALARDKQAELAREKLTTHLGRQNLDGELAFFRESAGQFQRPYGYAWLLRFQAELLTWQDSAGKQWATNVAPLASWMGERFTLYLAQLERPIRGAGQTNTAFLLSLALDYADAARDAGLRTALHTNARRFYAADRDCDVDAEPGGRGGGRRGGAEAGRAGAPPAAERAGGGGGGGGGGARGGGGPAGDFLSPCLAEAALMARVLNAAEFLTWFDAFLPPLHTARFAALRRPPEPVAVATGRRAGAAGRVGGVAPTDTAGRGAEARFSAMAFQRAQAMEHIARALPATDPRVPALRRLSALHAARALELMRADQSAMHWLPAFAMLYFVGQKQGSS